MFFSTHKVLSPKNGSSQGVSQLTYQNQAACCLLESYINV